LENAVENLVVIFIGLTTVAIVVQVCVLGGIFISIKKVAFNVERLRFEMEQKINPAVVEFRDVLGDAKQVLQSLRTAAENFAGVSETVRYQVERVNAVIEDTTDRARDQIARADEVITDAIEKMEATSAVVQQNVLAPIREVSALIRGVSGGLHFLFAKRKNQVDAVHQDEELFI
jgi:methyl-accepting chemotaxis protein